MKRINSIIKHIKSNSTIIDVGSDHALLSTSLVKHTPIKHIYNVEKNIGPLNNSIANTRCFNNITNIHANGLNFTLPERRIDYCVIAGMGGHKIIKIMTHHNAKKCQTFILQPANNTSDLRRFLAASGYFVGYEEIICEHGVYYDLLVVSKHRGMPIVSDEDIFFGPFNLKHRTNDFELMYQTMKKHIINKKLNILNRTYQKQLSMINNL
jgi:tRNA (adenine22-N1)-methyltransferase